MKKWDALNSILIEANLKDLLDIIYVNADWQKSMIDIIFEASKTWIQKMGVIMKLFKY